MIGFSFLKISMLNNAVLKLWNKKPLPGFFKGILGGFLCVVKGKFSGLSKGYGATKLNMLMLERDVKVDTNNAPSRKSANNYLVVIILPSGSQAMLPDSTIACSYII